ncbi:MAG TPA: hypothetical protein VFI24_26050 [Pyrinomonadaceae bacterium]|nr:hypothetical protein [Pyrinomonadaceae bacterium]
MSKYLPELSGRDGIPWPDVLGIWQQGTEINLLSTFAGNLNVSRIPGQTDLLSSVPAPWARLLLFENALFDVNHPSHRDVTDQWRGILGVIALAEPLGLKLDPPTTIDLSHYQAGVTQTFLDLRPNHIADHAGNDGQWRQFQLLSLKGHVLGGTSPRTLVFTGVNHVSPAAIPFSKNGRLGDPAAYYRNFSDQRYLGMLRHWLKSLMNKLRNSETLSGFLGTMAAARGAEQHQRLTALIDCLASWESELSDVVPIPVPETQNSVFSLPIYNLLTGLGPVSTGESDLYLRGEKRILIGYQPNDGSRIYNANEFELQGEPLLVYDGHWVRANNPLPAPLDFIPYQTLRLEDPVRLFEDRLIEVILPVNPEAVYFLELASEKKRYLFPFKAEILDFLSPDEIHRSTQITQDQTTKAITIELRLSLVNGRVIKVAHTYSASTDVITGDCERLIKWPDFVSPHWHRYLYFKEGRSSEYLKFSPHGGAVSRDAGKYEWYLSEEPLLAFVGTHGRRHSGLLLLRQPGVPEPTRYWRIAVDFGSTHTRVFSLEVDKQGEDSYVGNPQHNIQPLTFHPRAKLLTALDDETAFSNFLDFGDEEIERDWLIQEELYTLLMQPSPNVPTGTDWLPREGFAYKRSVLGTKTNFHNLRQDLKWNSNLEDHDLRAFLRCLLLMAQAEACWNGAQVISVAHTYPSVFTEALKGKHNDEWASLEEYLALGQGAQDVTVDVLETGGVTETHAVCQHLASEQGANPTNNTISLDVGGSTTDMAVWGPRTQGAGGELKVQESIKMAAGLIGRYLDAQTASSPFLKWLTQTVNRKPYEAKLELQQNGAGRSGLLFNTFLSSIDRSGHLPNFIDRLNGAVEARSLLSHIMFLFSGLIYYAGLLTRRGLPNYATQDAFYIYFCGRGGKLIEWVGGYREMTTEMFIAGLYRGQDLKPANRGLPVIDVRVSSQPKQEVGRGLLAEVVKEANPNRRAGLQGSRQPTVTVGETGYKDLEWNGDLKGEHLVNLPANTVPHLSALKELSTFLTTFKNSKITGDAARELGFSAVTAVSFENKLKRRLFAENQGAVISDLRHRPDNALLESLFITELKVWLETATNNDKLFR